MFTLETTSSNDTRRPIGFLALLCTSAMLLFATATFAGIPGDIDGDTDIDVDDIGIILASRNLPSSGPGDPLDLDSDGTITVLDSRIAVTLCTRPLCAVGNNLPTITDPADQTINEDATTGALAVTVGDPDIGIDPNTLVLTASSSDQTLIPDGNLTLGGAGTARTIDVAPVADGNGGPVTVTLVIDDGFETAMTTFTITVDPVNDAPTLDAIADPAAILEDAAQQMVSLAGIGSGAANETQVLTVTATSDNTAVILDPVVTYTSADATGTLAYTPGAGESGTAVITVTVMDDGGVVNGGIDTVMRTFTVEVLPVNEAPTIAAIADPAAILEDSAQQTINLSGISSGDANEVQTLTVTATSDDTTLIPDPTVIYTSPDATGTLMYTPVADQSGAATITVTVMDDGGTTDGGVDVFSVTFVVAVTAVNDAPTLDAIADPAAILEDAAQQTVNLAGIGPGAANETQVLAVTATSDNIALIPNPTVTYTSAAAIGTLMYTPTADESGTAVITVTVVDDGGTADGGVDTVTRTFTVAVSAVNEEPTLDAIADPAAVLENAAQQTVNLTGIGSGAANETQVLAVSATSNNNGLIPNPTVTYTSPGAAGSLQYTPVADQSGTATITVVVMDDGGTANGGDDTFSQTFDVVVTSVNDAPTLNAIANPAAILEDAVQQTINIAGIGTGAADETQVLTVTATSSNTGLIPNPTVTYTSPGAAGSLQYTPVANQSGTATITVTVMDDGGTADGGNDSVSRTFDVSVTSVNDAPTLDAIANPAAILEDAVQQSVNLAGIGTGAANETQLLVVTAVSNNTSLIPNPTVIYTSANATGTLTYTPVADQSGTATITVTVMDDGGTANGGVNSFVSTFDVAVTSVNDAPTLAAIANPAAITEGDPQQTVGFSGVAAGGGETQVLAVTATSGNTGLIPNPTVTYTSANATGTLMYTPVASQTGTAVITVTVTDDGGTANGGVNAVSQMFTVTVNAANAAPMITSPAMASAAENQTFAIDVQATDDLDSEGAGLTYSLTGGADQASFTIGATGALNFIAAPNFEVPGSNDGDNVYSVQATVTDTGPGPPLTAVQNLTITVTNVNEPPTLTNDPIGFTTVGNTQLRAGGPGSPAASFAHVIDALDIFNKAAIVDPDTPVPAGITISLVSGPTHGSLNLNADGSFTYSPAVGNSTAASFVYQASDGANMVSGTVMINIVDQVWYVKNDQGSVGTGTSADPLRGLADAESGGSTSGAGDTIFVFEGDGTTTNQNAGIALGTNQQLIGHTAATLLLSGVTIQTPAPAGRPMLSNPSGDGITLGSGNTVRGFDIANSSAAGFGIDDNGNVGVAVLTDIGINNTAGGGVRVDSGGTITATGVNTIVTTADTALNVTNTIIGAAGLTFRSISANGAVNGIVLSGTGTSGGLTVTGDGSNARNGSGGTIQNTTSHGIVLTSTDSFSATSLNLTSPGNSSAEDGIRATNITGSGLYRSGVVTGISQASADGIRIENTSTDLTLFEVRDSLFIGQNSGGNDGIFVNGLGTSTMRIDIVGSSTPSASSCTGTTNGNVTQFDSILGDGVQVSPQGSSTITLNLRNSCFTTTQNYMSTCPTGMCETGTSRFTGSLGGNGTMRATVENNIFQDTGTQTGILPVSSQIGVVDFGANDASTLRLRFRNNLIEDIEVEQGLRILGDDNPAEIDAIIASNILRDILEEDAIFLYLRESTVLGNISILNNTIGEVGSPIAEHGIEVRVQSRDTGSGPLNPDVPIVAHAVISGNTIVNNDSGSESIDLESEVDNPDGSTSNPGATFNATVTGNTITNQGTGDELEADSEDGIGTGEPQGRSVLCLDMNSNILASGAGTVVADEDSTSPTNADLNIVQAGAASLASANGIPAANVTTAGSPNFGAVASCTQPTHDGTLP